MILFPCGSFEIPKNAAEKLIAQLEPGVVVSAVFVIYLVPENVFGNEVLFICGLFE
ncbi:hypothetical protein LEP1GSC016_2830 [Leptospira borgpetersenii serovar Hardjo-bovis str. Sponselee]|uniref:Uncharacterized protein n=1 Tax=Leptospira borgpetersenii serovar Hardjo-bovis str. Sponselee TaxID=1303729 RepID=M6C2C5_LEPBO|nr:hypothetical protein LEP1GSC016_2830 [Leptospira borgpetersenii serovar Hardjo-bovis str. Sponselee]